MIMHFLDALTDGTSKIHLDANMRPVLRHKGIATKNTNGLWNVVCGDQSDVFKNGAETAGQICSILGFRYSYQKYVFAEQFLT